MDLVIRPAEDADAGTIATLMEQLGYPVAPETVEQRLRRLGDRRAVFVARDGETVIGWVCVSADETFVDGFAACIEGLVVAEGRRGAGLGARLVDAAERWAIAQGCEAVTVRSNVVRARAHAFYDRVGFTTIKAQRLMRKAL